MVAMRGRSHDSRCMPRPDCEEIQRYAEKLGYFDFRPVTAQDPFGFDDYVDPSFVVQPPKAPAQ